MDRRTLLGGIGACAACAVAGGVAGRLTSPDEPFRRSTAFTGSSRTRRLAQPDAIFSVDTDQPLVGLSFDDGPDPRFTPDVLDLLAQRDATATFFVVGVNALAHPDLVTAYQEAGHRLANHTRTHQNLEMLPLARVEAEISGCEQDLLTLGVDRPHLFRPPKGFTDEAVGVLADANRYRTVFWTQTIEDFLMKHDRVDDAMDDLLRNVGPGSIILGHDGGHVETPNMPFLDRSRTVEALPHLLDGLHRKGLTPVGIDALMASATRRSP